MKRMWIAAPAALVLMSSVAFAENLYSEETQTNTSSTITKKTEPTTTSTYNATESHSCVNGDGSTCEQEKTYHADPNGSNMSSSSKTVAPDGSQVSVTKEKKVITPSASTTYNKTTTTTTTDE